MQRIRPYFINRMDFLQFFDEMGFQLPYSTNPRPSGLYFYRMTAGAFVQTKKAILIR